MRDLTSYYRDTNSAHYYASSLPGYYISIDVFRLCLWQGVVGFSIVFTVDPFSILRVLEKKSGDGRFLKTDEILGGNQKLLQKIKEFNKDIFGK